MISRVEAGSAAAEMSDVDLSQSVADCVELYEPVADEQGLTLEAELPPAIHVSGNRELIGQALGNLIDNAIKYSEGGDNPLIKVSLVKRDGAIVVSVAETRDRAFRRTTSAAMWSSASFGWMKAAANPGRDLACRLSKR